MSTSDFRRARGWVFLTWAAAIVGITDPAIAQSQQGGDAARIQDAVRSIEAMRRLPGTGLQMVQAGGQTFLMTDNGRFAVVQGRLWDVWHGEELRTIADLDRAASRLDLAKMRIDFRELAALARGPERAPVTTIFLDPACDTCQPLLSQVAQLKAEFRFRLVLVPRTDEGVETAKRLLCAPSADVAFDAIVQGRIQTLPTPDARCGLGALQKTLVTARILGVETLPTVVSADGRLSAGAHSLALRAFIKGS